MGALDGGMPRRDGGMHYDDIIDRLLDAHGNDVLPPYGHADAHGSGTHAASSAPWLDALLEVPPARNGGAASPWQSGGAAAYGTVVRHDGMSQDGMTGMATTPHVRLHRSGVGSGTVTRAQTTWQDTQVPSSVTGLLRADGLRAEAPSGRARASWQRNGGDMTGGASGIGLDDLLCAAGVSSDGCSGDRVDDVIDDDYTLPGDPVVAGGTVAKESRPAVGAGVVMTKVRPTRVLGGYDMLGGIWDGVLQGLVVFSVAIIPLATMTLLAQNVFGLLCTSPLCIVFPVASVALSLAGARLTKALHCDLWDRLTTPDAAPSSAVNNFDNKNSI